ncbi:hypothetical protein ACLEPN_21290 [Myxococcus sp. 1LA]
MKRLSTPTPTAAVRVRSERANWSDTSTDSGASGLKRALRSAAPSMREAALEFFVINPVYIT